MQRQAGGSWYYPPMEEDIQVVGLYDMETCIHMRQNTFAKYIAT